MAPPPAETTVAQRTSDAGMIREPGTESLVAPLFERIGGDAAVEAAVSIFYARLVSDPLVARFFEVGTKSFWLMSIIICIICAELLSAPTFVLAALWLLGQSLPGGFSEHFRDLGNGALRCQSSRRFAACIAKIISQ